MAERLNNDFQFLDVPRQDPAKKEIEQRTTTFAEIYQPFEKEEVQGQAHRCLGCAIRIANGSARSTTTSRTG